MASSRLLVPQPTDVEARVRAQLAALDARVRALEVVRGGPYVTKVIDAAGPLPLSAVLPTYGGRLLLIASGSGYTTSAPTSSEGLTLSINGTAVANSFMGMNVNNLHETVPTLIWGPTVPTQTLPLTIGLGHTTNFLSDANDRYSLIAIELL